MDTVCGRLGKDRGRKHWKGNGGERYEEDGLDSSPVGFKEVRVRKGTRTLREGMEQTF